MERTKRLYSALDDGHNQVIDMIDKGRSMAKYKIYAKFSN